MNTLSRIRKKNGKEERRERERDEMGDTEHKKKTS